MHTRALGKALGRGTYYGRTYYALVRAPATSWRLAMWLALATSVGTAQVTRADPLPPFHEIQQTAERKQRFFEYLTPVIRAENDRIRRQRERLLALHAAWTSGDEPRRSQFLDTLARQYDLKSDDLSPRRLLDALLRRVDVIPRSLVLAQAAKESAWGSSRFARQANNLFGQWCYRTGCGLVPRRRPEGMKHEVRTFDSVKDSVASYIKNLNTHDSYANLREKRAELRAAARPLSGVLLAEGLSRYSERGERYVREVQSLIRQNSLEEEGVPPAVVGS